MAYDEINNPLPTYDGTVPPTMNPKNRLVAILYCQGENDTGVNWFQDYEPLLQTLVQNLRQRINGAANTVFISGGQTTTWARGEIRKTIGRVQKYLKKKGVVNVLHADSWDPYPLPGDYDNSITSVHYAWDSYNELARRYFRTFLAWKYNATSTKATIQSVSTSNITNTSVTISSITSTNTEFYEIIVAESNKNTFTTLKNINEIPYVISQLNSGTTYSIIITPGNSLNNYNYESSYKVTITTTGTVSASSSLPAPLFICTASNGTIPTSFGQYSFSNVRNVTTVNTSRGTVFDFRSTDVTNGGSYISVLNGSNSFQVPASYTGMGWFNITSNPFNTTTIVGLGQASGNYINMQLTNGNVLNVRVNNSSILGSFGVSRSGWHHLCMSYDSTLSGTDPKYPNVKLYVNGEMAGVLNCPANGTGSANGLNIGAATGIDKFRGDLDSVQMFNTVLSDRDIAEYYYSQVRISPIPLDLSGNVIPSTFNTLPLSAVLSPIVISDGARANVLDLSSAAKGYLNCPTFAFSSASYTKMAWIKPTQSNKVMHIMSSSSNTAFAGHYLYINNENKLVAGHNDERILVSNVTIPTNAWTHVCVTYDAYFSKLTLFMNGEILLNISEFCTWTKDTGLQIGCMNSDASTKFIGYMQNVTVYDGFVTPVMVKAKYTAEV
jgi:hypothetical protein